MIPARNKDLKPYPWQPELIEKTIRFLNRQIPGREDYNLLLNVCGTGIGKTFITLFAARQVNRPVFVLCPKSVIDKWKKACDDVGVHAVKVINPGYVVHHKKHSFGKWFRRQFEWTLNSPDTIIIVDELHDYQGHNTKAAKLLKEALSQKFQCVGLTASPYDSPLKMWAVGIGMKFHIGGGDFTRWSLQNGASRNPFGGVEFKRKEGFKSALEQVPDLIISKSHEEIPDFPKNRTFAEPISLTNVSAETFNKKHVKAMQEAEKEALLPVVAQTRARQYTEFLKVEPMLERALEYRGEGNSICLFFNYKESIKRASELLTEKKIQHGLVYSDIPHVERELSKAKFQSNELDVIIVAVAAGGQSIDLHDVHGGHPRVSLISPSFNPVHMMQVPGRVWRTGAKSPSMNILCFASGTIEDEVRRKVQKKIDAMGKIAKLAEEDLLTNDELAYQENFIKTKGEKTMSNIPKELIATKEETDHSQRAHSKFSPSGMKNYKACPGYTPDNDAPPHPTTLQGTRIHEALDAENPALLNGDDAEELDLYEMCMDVQHQIIEEFEKEYGHDSVLIKEPELKFLLGSPYEQKGHIDLLILNDSVTHADITDWKLGYHQVDAAEINLQGMGYTLGVFESYPTVQTVKVRFVQPRCDFISEHTFHRQPDASNIREEYLRIISSVLSPTKILNPDPQGVCRFCKVKGTCSAMNNKVVKQASVLNQDPDLITPDDLNNMDDPRVRGKLLTLAYWITDWADAVKKSQMDWYLETGIEPEGFVVTERKGTRTITEPALAYEAIKNEVPVEVFIEKACKVNLGSLEKIYASHCPTSTTASATRALTNKLEELEAVSTSPASQYFRKQK